MKRLTKEEIVKELKRKGFSVRNNEFGIMVSVNKLLCPIKKIDDLGVHRWWRASETVDKALKDIQYGTRVAFS